MSVAETGIVFLSLNGQTSAYDESQDKGKLPDIRNTLFAVTLRFSRVIEPGF